MTEDAINRETAKRYTPQQLRDELKRIDNAIKATGWVPGTKCPPQVLRWHKRRAIFQAEVFRRAEDSMAGASDWYKQNRYSGD